MFKINKKYLIMVSVLLLAGLFLFSSCNAIGGRIQNTGGARQLEIGGGGNVYFDNGDMEKDGEYIITKTDTYPCSEATKENCRRAYESRGQDTSHCDTLMCSNTPFSI